MSTNQEILEKAIQKAIDGGFSFSQIWSTLEPWWKYEILGGDEDIAFYSDTISPNPWRMNFSTLIFNHDFAKALWGEEKLSGALNDGTEFKDIMKNRVGLAGGCRLHMDAWEWHLMNMVIAKDPIKYLGEHI